MVKDLTDAQKTVLKNDGKYVVRACPGSGKTLTVAAKMAKLLKEWQYSYQGVAVISFTNVACQEIENQINSFNINTPIKHPHFLGTIDSFINQFIFFQYGHLLLNCDKKPALAGEPVYPWKNKKYDKDYDQYFDKITCDIDGNMTALGDNRFFFGKLRQYNNDNVTENGQYTRIKKMKKRYWKMGLANQSDANYFSMKLLKDYPSIAETIALRFPFIIIDEAQDTSKIQMAIIDTLVENGLENIILMGDPDQAIFEWNSAKPKLFNNKYNEWNDSITMNENWRSSQNICNFTYFLSELTKCSISKNKDVAKNSHIPLIIGYNPGNTNFNKLISTFLEICDSEGININQSDVAVLSRSKNLIEEIILSRNHSDISKNNINTDIWYQGNYAKQLAFSKYLYDKSKFQESFKLLEKTYVSLGRSPIYSDYELSQIINKKGYFNFKVEIFKLIELMPDTDKSIGEWINEFKINLTNIPKFLNLNLKIKKDHKNLSFADIFDYDMDDKSSHKYLLSTIHKVKGDSFEAVLLIIKKNATKSPHYPKLLNTKKTSNNEELRTIYVGITRPKRVLVLAVPFEHEQDWNNHFNGNCQLQTADIGQKTLDIFGL